MADGSPNLSVEFVLSANNQSITYIMQAYWSHAWLAEPFVLDLFAAPPACPCPSHLPCSHLTFGIATPTPNLLVHVSMRMVHDASAVSS